MGRTAKFDRDAAVETCMQEIWRSGFEACSVKALAEKLGITRSSFYNAFGSREALFDEVLQRYFAQSPDRVLNESDENTDVPRLLTGFFREICRARAADAEGRGCLAVNCVTELVGADETLGPMLQGLILARLQRLEALLRQAAAHGQIEDDGRLRDKALALQNLMVGLNVMAKVVRSEDELWALSEQTLRGLGLYRE